MSSLKQFIRNVRAAKTIADERAVVQKESAAIRASFREESHDPNVRRNNVAKLLYLFTLGERTHFGQIECLKLLASPRFADKRLGYLGTMLLLDENQEVLTLVTNSLQNDLNHSNQYIVGLALCTLGNIASVEMSRDLFPEIEKLISTSNPYIRRKAALCAMKICRKVPDLQEHFIDNAKILLNDRNHGVLLSGLTFVISLCEEDEAEGSPEGIVEIFRTLVPNLVKILKGLTSSGYAPEHDVTGVTDPFLQVKILHLLRVLARGDAATSELINDILAQVATNTDSSKNVGNAILYEAVLTILDIEADSGLRVLGVNILGKFLANKDNNIRYVALNTLIKVVAVEPNAVQRHRNTILECLRDPDISIRRRALDLSFTLINGQNVELLVRELLAFLDVADNEFKSLMTSQIGVAAEKFAPSKRWHVDTILRMLKLAGSYVKEQILASFIRLIATSPDQQQYVVQRLYADLREDITQEGLTIAAAWVIGEYGDALLRNGTLEDGSAFHVTEGEVIDLYENILSSAYATQIVTEYIITSAMKFSAKISSESEVLRVQRLLGVRAADLSVEVQQRAVEYSNLFKYEKLRREVLERMPPPEVREDQKAMVDPASKKKAAIPKAKATVRKPAGEDLLDLMSESTPSSAPQMNTSSQDNASLLADLLGGDSVPAASKPSSSSASQDILGLFGSSGQSNGSTQRNGDLLGSSATSGAAQQAYDKNNLTLHMSVQRSGGTATITARFKNTSDLSHLSGVSLQAAVPKSQKLQLQPVSKGELDGGDEATQLMRVTSATGAALPAKLRLRLKVNYAKDGGAAVVETLDWTES